MLFFRALGILCLAFAANFSHAGPHANAMTQCLVSNTTSQDKINMSRWVFSVMAAHPGVSDMARITPAQRTENNRKMARYFERLLTEKCVQQAKAVIQNEGEAALKSSFQTLGAIAMQELTSAPQVSASFGEWVQELDFNKFKALGLKTR